MKIGVTSQNFRTITGHAGKTRRFMIYDVLPDGQFSMVEKLDLPKDASMHETAHNAPHPIDVLNVLITGSCGDGFARKLAARGIKVITTSETDPQTAITAFLAGKELAPAAAEHDHSDDDGDGDNGHQSCGCQCGRG